MERVASPQTALDLKDKGFVIIAPWASGMLRLAPDSKNPDSPLANQKVRAALEYATDRVGIAKALGYGMMLALNQLCEPRYTAGYVPDLQGRDYNPTKAKQLLAEAGYANGLKTKIIAQTETTDRDLMAAIQANWKDVGVDLQLDYENRAAFVTARTKGWNNGFILISQGVQAVPTKTLDTILSVDGTTYTSVARPSGYTDMMNAANASLSFKEYQQRCQALVKYLHDQASFIHLWGTKNAYVTTPKVHDTGFLSLSYTWWTPATTWLSK